MDAGLAAKIDSGCLKNDPTMKELINSDRQA